MANEPWALARSSLSSLETYQDWRTPEINPLRKGSKAIILLTLVTNQPFKEIKYVDKFLQVLKEHRTQMRVMKSKSQSHFPYRMAQLVQFPCHETQENYRNFYRQVESHSSDKKLSRLCAENNFETLIQLDLVVRPSLANPYSKHSPETGAFEVKFHARWRKPWRHSSSIETS